jgi:RNA polymerase sigma-70 factor (sigma-E family)
MTSDEEFEAYVQTRLPGWRRIAYLMAGDWDRGDDVVQRMLTDLYRTWRRTRHVENLDAFVRTILTRRLLDERRLRWARVRLASEIPDRAAPPRGSAEERVDLIAALRRIPPRQRAVIVLRYFHDLGVEETAQVLGCAPGTVKSQTSRAIAALRRYLTMPEVEESR